MSTSSSSQNGSFNSADSSNATQTTSTADPFGLAALLGQQGSSLAGADSTRLNFLTNLLTNGPSNLQGQVSGAVNNALSGPGMFGAGDNARARAAAGAASGIGLGDLNSIITGASNITAPTAVANAATASVPFDPQTTTGNTASNATGNSSGGASVNTTPQSFLGGCCFIFLESYNGTLPWYVRACRDEFYTPVRRAGYVRMSLWLVPAMRVSRLARTLVNYSMVKPLTAYGRWYKDGVGCGYLAKPLVDFWFKTWEILGGL